MVLIEGTPAQSKPKQPGIAVGLGDVDSEALTQEKIDPNVLAKIPLASDSDGSRTGAPWIETSPTNPADHNSAPTGVEDGEADDWSEKQTNDSAFPVGEFGLLDGAVPPFSAESPPTGNLASADKRNSPVSADQHPPVAWQSESSAKVRQFAAVGVVALIGLMVASTAFFLVIRQWTKSRDSQQAKATPESVNPVDGSLKAVDRPAPASAKSDSDVVPPDDAVPLQDSTPLSTADGNVTIAGNEEQTTLSPQPAIGNSPTIGNSPAAGDSESDRNPLFPEVVIGNEVGGSKVGNEAENETTAEALPPSLAQYMQVIEDMKPDAAMPRAIEPAPAALDQLQIQFPQLMAASTEFPPPAAPVDVRARGDMRIIGVKADNQPLGQLLRVIGQAAGIPVQLELIGFDVVGRSVDQAVSITEKEIKVAPLLARTAQAAGCVLKLGDDGIVSVLPADAEIAAAVAKASELTDFGGKLPLEHAKFRLLINADEASVMRVQGDRLILEGDLFLSLRAALALEAIRAARSLPPKLDSARTGRWIRMLADGQGADGKLGNNSTPADWSPIQDHLVGINEDHEYGLELVLGDVAADAGAALVLDWKSCWSHGLTPDAKALPWYQGKKTDDIFEAVLRPFALQAFDAGTNVIWVGTQETYEQMELWAVLNAGSAPDTAVQRIALAVGKPETQTPAWLDETSGRVVVYLPRYILRQLPGVLAN